MGRLAKAPMMKQAMQEEAAVAVMRDFLVVACGQQWGPHQLGQYFPGASAEQGCGWMDCHQALCCAPCLSASHTAVGARSPRRSICHPSSCGCCLGPEQDHHAAAAVLRGAVFSACKQAKWCLHACSPGSRHSQGCRCRRCQETCSLGRPSWGPAGAVRHLRGLLVLRLHSARTCRGTHVRHVTACRCCPDSP